MNMFKSLRARLIASFISISMIGVLIVFINQMYNARKNNIDFILSEINNAQIIHLNDQKSFRDFLYIDTRKSDYYMTRKSDYLNLHDSLFKKTKVKIEHLLLSNDLKTLELENELKLLNTALDTFHLLTGEITKYIILKGFKDFGNTGEMRVHAHNLEEVNEFPKEYLLMMRRHEKDFIIRGEKKYADRFIEKFRKYRNYISNSAVINSKTKAYILDELDAYKANFDKLLMYTNIIGDQTHTGLYGKLDSITNHLQSSFAEIKRKSEESKEAFFARIRLYYIIILSVIIIGSIFLGVFIADKITKPITVLSSRMNKFVKSNFSDIDNFSYKTKTPEIKKLINNYFILKEEIVGLIQNLQEKVAERTKEIDRQNLQILEQNEVLKKQKEEVENINQNIYAGLTYAKYIQNALLPSHEYFKEHFPESFIYHKAKDIVSGDFYWINRFINVEGEDLSVFALADSTGHGVSGALMSMLGITFLDDITPRKDIRHASEVLITLRDALNSALQRNSSVNKTNNGMDLGLFVLNNKTMKLQFAGANRFMWIIREDDIIELKGDSLPLGGYNGNKTYSDYEIDLKDGDNLYLFTDGYTDQFGGDGEQKFLKKQFKQLLLEIANKPMDKQKELIDSIFKKWKKGHDQTDDILVVGIKV
jgi:serine phosphatase RsbU (regulator of sigma subunit)